MNYIYDILLNYNKNLYEFYEWNISDDICHIRKMPVFKVLSKQLKELTNNDIIIDNQFLKIISNKTEIFTKNSVKTIRYSCLFSDGDKVLALKFSKDGKIIGRSSLLVDEEEEVTDVVLRLKLLKLSYEILNKNKVDYFKTRREQEIENFIKVKIEEEDNLEKLRYLYFDCFGKKENNKEKIVGHLKKEMNKNWDEVHMKIYNFFKLLSR